MPGLCGTLPASLGPLSSEDTKYKLLRIGAGMSCDSDREGCVYGRILEPGPIFKFTEER